jgi:hypothetical protein
MRAGNPINSSRLPVDSRLLPLLVANVPHSIVRGTSLKDGASAAEGFDSRRAGIVEEVR